MNQTRVTVSSSRPWAENAEFLAWPSGHVSHPHAYCTGSDGSTSVSGLCRMYIFCVL